MSIAERMAAAVWSRQRAAHQGRFSAYARGPYQSGRSDFGESFTAGGAVLITPQQRALLTAIRDAPENTFPTMSSWVQAATPLLEDWSKKAVRRCIQRMPDVWVSRTPYRIGRLCALQARGRAIIEGKISVWVRGEGRYRDYGTIQYLHEQEMLSRMSLGQLLDWIAGVRKQSERDVNTAETDVLRKRLIDGEITLSSWRATFARPRRASDGDVLAVCQVAAEQGDLQRFLMAVTAMSPSSLASAGRYALSFERPEQQWSALQEVVLAAEVAHLGLEEAAARRQRSNAKHLHGLQRRLVEVIPKPR